MLANEEVTNEGRSDRGDYPVYRRALRQWMLRITAYAERLLVDLDGLDWPESIKTMQRNWIGRSTGAEVDFPLQAAGVEDFFRNRRKAGFSVEPGEDVIRVYTTRPDTLFGATYMVLAPEHALVERITTAEQRRAVQDYVAAAARKSELERTADTKEKSGVFTGAYAVNPVNRQPVPIWVADYVMMGYGTGAIMAVPAHDTRDLEFAEAFGLPVIQVVQPPAGVDWRGYVEDGVAVHSGQYDGLPTAEFKAKVTADLESAGLGRAAVKYKIRDWLFSRQRYWGEPFPIVHCDRCGIVALGEDALPLELPDMADFTPQASDDPNAPPSPPLGRAGEWGNAACPRCGGEARRELNTMPQWAGSCWYYLRFLDPGNDKALCDPKVERYWMAPAKAARGGGGSISSLQSPAGGVDLYVGGAEHAVLHLLYARFWHKVLHDLGYVSSPEPFARLFNQGMIRSFAYRDRRGVYVGYEDVDLSGDAPRHKTTGEELAESVEKMSKSLKNVVTPDEVIAQYGADTIRLYEMFMGPLEASKPWNTRDVPGVHRFLHRVWRMIAGSDDRPALLGEGGETIERALHKLIRKVGSDIPAMKFNTAIAAMMEFVNAVYKIGGLSRGQAERFVQVLAPFAPHIAEELWHRLGHDKTLAYEPWPGYDPARVTDEVLELAVQVNGKLRGRITVPADAADAAVVAAALAEPKVAAAIAGKNVVKRIVVPGKLVNLVVK
ncbi:MAG: leucine--tRNA ligase [Phycisphaerae bacterium]|nr:leucine--tRNA ligase [Phycisphaerae bacterium]